MIYFFYAIHVVICFFLILVVLLQQGKGADLSVFGGGGTMTAFGARGAATMLHKMTVFSFVGFIVTTLVIGVLQRGRADETLLSGVEQEAPAEPVAADTEAETEAPEPVGAFAPDSDADEDGVEPATAADVPAADEAGSAEGEEGGGGAGSGN